MATAWKIVKVMFRAIGWLLLETLRMLALTLGACSGGSFSNQMIHQQGLEVEQWQRHRMQPDRLYRR